MLFSTVQPIAKNCLHLISQTQYYQFYFTVKTLPFLLASIHTPPLFAWSVIGRELVYIVENSSRTNTSCVRRTNIGSLCILIEKKPTNPLSIWKAVEALPLLHHFAARDTLKSTCALYPLTIWKAVEEILCIIFGISNPSAIPKSLEGLPLLDTITARDTPCKSICILYPLTIRKAVEASAFLHPF